jgi:hypothetical protein
MYNPDTELLFPPRLLPQVRLLRGDIWRALVDSVVEKAPASAESVAFELMMVRLHGCVTCQADSYRAMQGCTQCALQTVKRLRGTDEELARQYQDAFQEVTRYLNVV